MVRTRIAPSPTGYPHIGTIYQALFDFAFAKGQQGKFVVRIEDTDRERFVEDAEEKLYEALDWFSLIEDESPRKGGAHTPYKQSERLDIYKKYAQELLEKDHAYYCFCTKERLEEVRVKLQAEKKLVMYDKHCRNLPQNEIEEKLEKQLPYVIRMKVPQDKIINCEDMIRGQVPFESNTVDDQVIMKSDGFPTYHLASVVDDHLMKVSHVLRGEEWLPSFPKHWLLYEFFGWKAPYFYHMATLRNPDKSKLSKRQGHTNIAWYKEEGYLSDAILNFLALLGWTHTEEKEIFSIEEFIDNFDFTDIHKAGPIFDLTKLTWMNQQYIQRKSDEELKNLLLNFYPKVKQLSDERFTQLMPLVKTRMKTLKEFEELTRVFFSDPDFQPLEEKEKETAQNLHDALKPITSWDGDNIFQTMKTVMTEQKVKMPLFYKLFLGVERGLPLPQILEILGKERSLDLLTKARTA